MRKFLICAMVVGVGFAAVAVGSAVGRPEVVRAGNLVFRDNGGVVPEKLPRHEQAPISANIKGLIKTTDGTHPPAVESVVADFDKTIHVNAKGLPVCQKAQLTARSTKDAMKVCSDALVGSGKAYVEVAFPEQKPILASGPVSFFNGGVHGGETVLFIHTYVDIPAPTAVVATVKFTKIHRGHYGLHTVAQIPPIAGGAGSVTKYDLEVGRSFTYKGKKKSYLTASCPTGLYYAEGKVQFSDGTRLEITHALPCTPID
jgi:hypothetical protein